MEFYNDEHASVGFNEEFNYTYMEYKKHVNAEQFLTSHEQVVEMLRSMKSYSGKHLVDTKLLKTVSVENQEWVAKNVVPLIHEKSEKGKATIALVLSDDIFGKFAVQNIKNKTDDLSETHFFDNYEEALSFLKNK